MFRRITQLPWPVENAKLRTFGNLVGLECTEFGMSVADHFEHAPDARFIRDYDSNAARRQFNLSVTLIVVIALAASALALLVRFDGPSASPPGGLDAPPAYAGHL